MSRAEKFIDDCTRNCSNELISIESRAGKEVISYHSWLTPDQARRAVEIAMEEEMEYMAYQLELFLPETLDYNGIKVDRSAIINDIKQAMKDEMS